MVAGERGVRPIDFCLVRRVSRRRPELELCTDCDLTELTRVIDSDRNRTSTLRTVIQESELQQWVESSSSPALKAVDRKSRLRRVESQSGASACNVSFQG